MGNALQPVPNPGGSAPAADVGLARAPSGDVDPAEARLEIAKAVLATVQSHRDRLTAVTTQGVAFYLVGIGWAMSSDSAPAFVRAAHPWLATAIPLSVAGSGLFMVLLLRRCKHKVDQLLDGLIRLQLLGNDAEHYLLLDRIERQDVVGRSVLLVTMSIIAAWVFVSMR